ncbi:hypothetical protein EsH8_XII_000009 [Colletotrichum jinshuiense]
MITSPASLSYSPHKLNVGTMVADLSTNADEIGCPPSNIKVEINEDSEGNDAFHEGVKAHEDNHFQAKLPGDGIIMAEFDGSMDAFPKKDAYFHAKLTEVERTRYREQDVYLIRFVFRFVRSFSRQFRFRGADIDISVKEERPVSDTMQDQSSKQHKQQGCLPKILKIYPEGLPINISEQEIQNGSDITAGAGATPGPAQINFSVTQTHQRTAKFKGGRFINGLIKGSHDVASWRIFEDRGSQSGIPSIINTAMLVRCPRGRFQVHATMSARMPKGPKMFGLHHLYFNSNHHARSTKPTIIPELEVAFSGPKLWDKLVDSVLAKANAAEEPVSADERDSANKPVLADKPDSASNLDPSTDSTTSMSSSDRKSTVFDMDWGEVVTLTVEEKRILGRASDTYRKAIRLASDGKQMRYLLMLKRYLYKNDRSFLVMKDLEESAGMLYDDDAILEKGLPELSDSDDDGFSNLPGAYAILKYMSPDHNAQHLQRLKEVDKIAQQSMSVSLNPDHDVVD